MPNVRNNKGELVTIDADDTTRLGEFYVQLRAQEYPPMSDYLDGIAKGDHAQVQAYIDACLAVKKKYPKPAPI
jgi:hypothetical protein